IGLRNAGIIVAHPATVVALGNLRSKGTLLALFGLLLIAALMVCGVRAAMLIGIVATAAIGLVTRTARWEPQVFGLTGLGATAGKLDIAAAFRMGLLEIIFVFLFIDLFDNLGTLVAVGKKAGLFDRSNRIPMLNRILISDALASIIGALTGTSTVVS